MKITATILALAAAGYLGHAMADDSGRTFSLGITSDGHGNQHFQYHQDNAVPNSSVALDTSSGGVTSQQGNWQRPLTDGGNTRFVIGTNQHGVAAGTYIPVSSNFAPAGQ
jgi:hypothetical protein